MPLDQRFFENVCDRFGLGAITGRPLAIDGGLSNRLHHVVTDRGEYAVKRMVANAEAPAFKSNVESSFRVERLAHEAGIAMPEPIPVAGTLEALGRVNDGAAGCWVRVHRWVTAARLDAEHIVPETTADVGAILATLHGLPLLDAESKTTVECPRERDWRSALATQPPASRLLGAIEELEGIVRRGHDGPRLRRVLSHRDLDAKNVLRDAQGTLIVIDWDAAGPTNAQWDAVGVALDWSARWDGTVSQPAFDRFLEAYASAGGILDPVTPERFAGWSEGMLDWLWFSLERSGSPDAHERRLGNQEVAVTARFLPTAAKWITTQQ